MKTLLFIFSIVLLHPVSNAQSNDNDSAVNGRRLAMSERIIPLNLNPQDFGNLGLTMQRIGTAMDLTPMNKINERLSIRIWIWSNVNNYLVKIDDDIKVKRCTAIEYQNKKVKGIWNVIVRRGWQIEPRDGWARFIDTLKKYRLTGRKGRTPKQLADDLTNGYYVGFEISQKGAYRSYVYYEPSYFRKVDSASREIYDFLSYLNNQVGFAMYKPRTLVRNR